MLLTLTKVVVSGVFSAVNSDHETQTAAIISEMFPEMSVTASHKLSGAFATFA